MRDKQVLRTMQLTRFHRPGERQSQLKMVGGVCSKVSMVGITQNARQMIARVTQGYSGTYSADEMDPELQDHYNEQVMRTKLRTPLEMVGLTWLIQGVTRGWTHQAVRYRVGAAYVQESMRFWGYRDIYEVFVPPDVFRSPVTFNKYCDAACRSVQAYVDMKDQGASDQDARGVLPTNVLTQMFMHTQLSTLVHIFNTRWCCQAQTDEWLPILLQMRHFLEQEGLDNFVKAPIQRGEPCGFNAEFDRPCTWKNRTTKQIEELYDENLGSYPNIS